MIQRLTLIQIEIRKNGSSPDLLLRKASIALALGQADDALRDARYVLKDPIASKVMQQEAIWISVLSICLRAGVLEGELEGAPGWRPDPRGLDASACRKLAKDILMELDNRGADEAMLLRKLRLSLSLKCVSELISSGINSQND